MIRLSSSATTNRSKLMERQKTSANINSMEGHAMITNQHPTLSKKTPTLTSNLALYRLNTAEKIQWLTRQERRRACTLLFFIGVCAGFLIWFWL